MRMAGSTAIVAKSSTIRLQADIALARSHMAKWELLLESSRAAAAGRSYPVNPWKLLDALGQLGFGVKDLPMLSGFGYGKQTH